MAARVAVVAEPMWGTTTTLSSSASPGASRGSSSNTSRPAAAMVPGRSASTSADFVHQGPPGRVDQDRTRLHGGQGGGIDEVAALIVERGMQAHEIRRGQQLVERDPTGPGLASAAGLG